VTRPAERDGAGRDGAGRDRDGAGRARNARPRDGLGRPLERGSAGEPPPPDEGPLPPADALETAQRLLDAGRPFHAHEVLEASWKAAPPDERDLWQGLAQIAVGLTHARRGNATGAVTLLRRGAARISPYRNPGPDVPADARIPADARPGRGPADGRPHAVDVAGIVAAAAGLADRIDRDGLRELPPGGLRLRLRAEPTPGTGAPTDGALS
jgi:uncharacterized protein